MILHGDLFDALPTLADNSIDACVTDGPYELGFMGRAWDKTGIVNSPETWRHVLRVLKPGGYLLSFGATRTYHRMACAVEDAGFELRDCLSWMYGSGFPKSLDVSKAIDEAAGATRDRYARPAFGETFSDDQGTTYGSAISNTPITDAAKQWHGWGTALKPAWEPILVARKPLAGTVASNVQEFGTGAMNIEGSRVAGIKPVMERTSTVVAAKSMSGQSTGATSTGEMTTEGRWPANVLLTHSPECVDGVCDDDCPVKLLDAQTGDLGVSSGGRIGNAGGGVVQNVPVGKHTKGDPGFGDSGGASRFFNTFAYDERDRTPPSCNLCGAAMLLDACDDGCAPQWVCFCNGGNYRAIDPVKDILAGQTRFLYTPKPSREERDMGCYDLPPATAGEATDRDEDTDGLNSPRAGAGRKGGARNYHPTVKPVALMIWLVKLVTPKGGTVLDCFLGSGTTGMACRYADFNFIGVEQKAEYVEIARRRITEVNGLIYGEEPVTVIAEKDAWTRQLDMLIKHRDIMREMGNTKHADMYELMIIEHHQKHALAEQDKAQ